MKINYFMATIVAIGFHVSGSVSAQNTSTIPEVELIPNTWVCINNGNPDCQNPPIVARPLTDKSPNAYDISRGKLEKGNWNCINNGNSVCDNPTRFNVVPAKNKK